MDDRDRVTQRQLTVLMALRRQYKEAKKQADELGKRLDESEKAIVTALVMSGLPVESGRYAAGLERVMGKCAPPWKDVHLTHMHAEHEVPLSVAEERVRALFPAQEKLVLVVVDTKAVKK